MARSCACGSRCFSFGGAVGWPLRENLKPHGLVTVAPALSRIAAYFRRPDCLGCSCKAMSEISWTRRRCPRLGSRLARSTDAGGARGRGAFFHGRLASSRSALRHVLCARTSPDNATRPAMLKSLSELLSKASAEPAGNRRDPGPACRLEALLLIEVAPGGRRGSHRGHLLFSR